MKTTLFIYLFMMILLFGLMWLGRKSRQKKHSPSIGTPIKQEEIEQWHK